MARPLIRNSSYYEVPPRRRTATIIGAGLALALCNPISAFGLNAVQFVAAPEWMHPLLIGLFILGMLSATGLVILVFYLPIRFIRELLGDRQPNVLLATSVAALLVCGGIPLATGISKHLREVGLARTRARAKPLIAALEDCKEKTGRYPTALSALVPEFLPSLPRTGSAVFPEFHYLPANEHTPFHSYELSIPAPTGPKSFDRYLFWPEREYPVEYSRVGLSDSGDWVFWYD